MPAITALAILLRKNMCMRYIPNEHFEMSVMIFGADIALMQVNIRKAPNVASNTLGVQNSHDHSSKGVSII